MKNKILDSDGNILFSNLNSQDLTDILKQIEKYYLEYRDTLNLPSSVSFGTEIEYEEVSMLDVGEYLYNSHLKNRGWISKDDGSLIGGGEITSPVKKDVNKYWHDLKKVCNYLTDLNVNTSTNAGGHIHVGAHILDDIKKWILFLKIYMLYEGVLYRFFCGDKINGRSGMTNVARPTAGYLYKNFHKIKSSNSLLNISEILKNHDRRTACNFQNVSFDDIHNRRTKNTIEFRTPNATANEIIWQNNINAITKMLLTSSKDLVDEQLLNYKLKKEFIPYEGYEYIYSEINLKKALEFIDLIFDNNLDKIYFLRQYLKNYETTIDMPSATMAKRFTK